MENFAISSTQFIDPSILSTSTAAVWWWNRSSLYRRKYFVLFMHQMKEKDTVNITREKGINVFLGWVIEFTRSLILRYKNMVCNWDDTKFVFGFVFLFLFIKVIKTDDFKRNCFLKKWKEKAGKMKTLRFRTKKKRKSNGKWRHSWKWMLLQYSMHYGFGYCSAIKNCENWKT